MIDPWNKFPEIKPTFYGDYLVIQKGGMVSYRWVRTWNLTEWTDSKEDRYGPIVGWMDLPILPEWAQS
jgi:hypothetical protein